MWMYTATVSLCMLRSAFATSNAALDYENIRNTLATYPLAIDGKNFDLLSEVFTPDVVANYSAPLNVLTGLEQLETVLQQALAPVSTQHALSTQRISLHTNNRAASTTYFTASHFGRGEYEGQVLYAYGRYEDLLTRIRAPGPASSDEWRVFERKLVYMGPNIGNASIFLGPAA